MEEIKVMLDGVVKCIYCGTETLPDAETMKAMKAAGYKFYKDGKIYRPEKK